MRIQTYALLVVGALWLLGGGTCNAESLFAKDDAIPINRTNYLVRGVLKAIRERGTRAVIAHEKIPGYMGAMTMEFPVRDDRHLQGLKAGDAIRFRMVITDQEGWIEQVQKVGGPANPATKETMAEPPSSMFKDAEILEAGAQLPDATIILPTGRKLRLRDYRGQALAFTFIFTRCPFPTFCPRMNNQFAAVQQLLEKSATGTNWQLLSLSFDSEYDTPQRLAAYATNYHPATAHWNFATGAKGEIRQLGKPFGLLVMREQETFSHNLRTVVVDPTGRIQKIFSGGEWTPQDLAEEMIRAMVISPGGPPN